MFGIGDSIHFTFDEHRRQRISVPEPFLPLAAWLHTDVQPNLAALDGLIEQLRHCRQIERRLLGNGCSIDFVNDVVLLESLYRTWQRCVIPQSLFWPVLDGLRNFLIGTAAEPGLARPAGLPEPTRMTTEVPARNNQSPHLVDHTYFPVSWSEQEVAQAGDGAWASPELIYDQATGAWSGMWRGMELAGYYDVATGEALTYFPVLSP
ncbi:EndoU nuclease [Saccharopolyspora antimicrobica]|uniref:EndoU nuclease n=2 Tax=Saccharopolyspora antimicrobica TaxID=455193 RepID=A0A1I4XGU0_9PSEU|nr:EndoU domain-containing protein [Saccharopolyspora antimicrobica]RKT84499.1 EndoU nuclease-like protein [Saccharopolyspora antimicrobica]SFN24902.1 EndoU nuclease [Saccharopolyspora antimicrobica]